MKVPFRTRNHQQRNLFAPPLFIVTEGARGCGDGARPETAETTSNEKFVIAGWQCDDAAGDAAAYRRILPTLGTVTPVLRPSFPPFPPTPAPPLDVSQDPWATYGPRDVIVSRGKYARFARVLALCRFVHFRDPLIILVDWTLMGNIDKSLWALCCYSYHVPWVFFHPLTFSFLWGLC